MSNFFRSCIKNKKHETFHILNFVLVNKLKNKKKQKKHKQLHLTTQFLHSFIERKMFMISNIC